MSNSFLAFILICIITILLDLFFVLRLKIYKQRLKDTTSKKLVDKKKLAKLVFFEEPLKILQNSKLGILIKKLNMPIYIELFFLLLWALYIGADYLNLDPLVVPTGREFGSAIPSNHLWNQIVKCGWCGLWNSSQRGGFPALADIQGSMLHPVVIFTTLLFGVVNGAKITLIISFWIAGIAQWWIARELNVGWIPRMWSAGIAVAGGHLSGRMELGVYGVVLSTAACSLVFAALIRLSQKNTRKNALLVGLFIALAIVSGQGYMQVGLIAIFPIYLFFYWGKDKVTWSNYFITGISAFLFAAPFLVPFLHFSPNITKAFDPEFTASQPLSYFILNLVIDNQLFFFSNVMSKFPYPHLYTLYIGWIPILLFVFALNRIKSENRKLMYFMLAGIAFEFLIASAILLKLLVGILPFLAGVRHSPQIAGLAIPFMLGISAYGLEQLLSIKWINTNSITPNWKKYTKWLILIPLVYSLYTCMLFSEHWIGTVKLHKDIFLTVEKLKTPDLQWVNTPFGEHVYIEPAIAEGLKLSPGILTWNWKTRIPPQSFLFADRKNLNITDVNGTEVTKKIETEYTQNNENLYAFIKTDSSKIIKCEAQGSGGKIEVYCDTNQIGTLIVKEYMWSGWYAWVDNQKTILIGTQFLELPAKIGKHTYTFRYLPWDVPLGLILFILGIFFFIRIWQSERKLNEATIEN